MGDRDVRSRDAEARPVEARPPEECEPGRPSRAADDSELAKRDAAHSRSERLHRRLLRREESRDVLRIRRRPGEPADLARPEKPLGETRSVAFDRARHARNLAEIDAEPDHSRSRRKTVLRPDAVAHAGSRGAGEAASLRDSRDSRLHASISEAAAQRCRSPRPRKEAPEIR